MIYVRREFRVFYGDKTAVCLRYKRGEKVKGCLF